jgi:hypothetical protein
MEATQTKTTTNEKGAVTSAVAKNLIVAVEAMVYASTITSPLGNYID